METENSQDMLSIRPSLARAAKTLDRSLFTKTLNLSAATIFENRNISKYRKGLQKSKELLDIDRLDVCRPDPVAEGKKCLLLKTGTKTDDATTWGPVVKEGLELKEISLVPFDVTLDYDFWQYLDVVSAILPEELHDEIPTGFNTAGHVAHLNLRDRYVPYGKIIAEVIMDKNPMIRTVINKVDNVGTESQFRTFGYEVLAGPDDLDVELKENGCIFKFDYSQVYWNTRLEPEHTRLINLFNPGEVVCDVMAGIGPFAVPAGKKGVFVFANDMNPDSTRALDDAILRNKVSQYVRSFNKDGTDFIKESGRLVYEASQRGDEAVIHPKVSRSSKAAGMPPPEPKRIPLPPTISHFVMNLPASALEFVHNFKGIYHGLEELFEPHTQTKLPMLHVHCFALKSDDEVPLNDICQRIYNQIGIQLKPGDAETPGEVNIYNVRDVAPAKRMFCATFRLPADIAFAPPTTS